MLKKISLFYGAEENELVMDELDICIGGEKSKKFTIIKII
jgi:hypothetical protein